jgi:hypothetical protein
LISLCLDPSCIISAPITTLGNNDLKGESEVEHGEEGGGETCEGEEEERDVGAQMRMHTEHVMTR